MNLNSLFAQIGNRYQQHYLDLAREAQEPRSQPAVADVPPGDSGIPRDEFVPSKPPEKADTYSFRRQARLDYALNLRFDLGAVTRAVESYSDGQPVDFEQFTQAGFGLTANLALSGFQHIQEQGTGLDADQTKQSFREASSNVAATLGSHQSRDMEAAWFSRESTTTRRSLKNHFHDGHRNASNKLEMRFRLDSSFRLTQINRFNDQTGRMAEQQPQALPGYFDNVGVLAETSSGSTLTRFFDAVDGYLDGVEDQLIERAESFFEAAAAELGFDGATVDLARDQLTGSIESFFGRVEAAMDQLQGQMVPSTSIPATTLPTTDTALNDLYNPAVAKLESLLATA